jgi:flagellin
MVINTNTSAQTSARLLSQSSSMLAKSLARLSSGSKIVSPEDDAAGLAVSTRFDAQINRLSSAMSNVGNAISYSQTQDGFLKKVSKALDRMSELSVLAQDATKGASDLTAYNTEYQKLADYVADLATKTFNGKALFGATSNLEVTTDSEVATAGKEFKLNAVDLTTTLTAIDTGAAAAIDTAANAKLAQAELATQIGTIAANRADVGANLSVLNSYSDQMGVLKDNLSSANSRIKDVDVAEESAAYAKYNILVQAGTAMLAQANTSTQSALRLLQ